MTSSIRGQLLLGLIAAAAAGAIVMTVIVGFQYRLFSASPPPLGATLREIGYHVLIPVLVFAFFFGTGAVIVVRQAARRLRIAADAATVAATRGESYRFLVADLPGEVRPFAGAVDALTEKLETHARNQEAFAADAAHELKTPLAVLALELDKLPADDAARLRREVTALSAMVDQLLLLARSNAPDIAARRQPIDLAALCRRLAAELAPTAIEKGRSVAFEDHGPTPVIGLEEAIMSALRTLVTNALRVTPEGGEVVLAAGPGSKVCVLDGGPGLDASMLDQLKARGVRADQAGGAGLGLAIAERIAAAHGGEVSTCMPERSGLLLRFASGPNA